MEFAVENAESYGIYPRERNDSELDEDSEDEYSDSIEGWAEEYAAEKHDGYKVGNTIYWNKL